MPATDLNGDSANRDQRFVTTLWSVVLAAHGSDSLESASALRQLCQTYWLPVYAFVRRSGNSPTDAADLTQEFFQHILANDFFERANPGRGRFRNFLLASLQNFLRKQWRDEHRLKKGGGASFIPIGVEAGERAYELEPMDNATPERLYERRYALALLEKVLNRLRAECAQSTRGATFEQLQEHLWGPSRTVSYGDLASTLGMTEGAVKVALHRLRGRYRELLREEVECTVTSESEVKEELRHLLDVLSG